MSYIDTLNETELKTLARAFKKMEGSMADAGVAVGHVLDTNEHHAMKTLMRHQLGKDAPNGKDG